MSTRPRAPEASDQDRAASCRLAAWERFLPRWFYGNLLVSGVFALAWLLLRTGTKPSRMTYPCQQAALSTASLALGAPLVTTVLVAWRRLLCALRRPAGLLVAGLGLFAAAGTWGYLSRADAYSGPSGSTPRGYRAKVYHVTDCPPEPVGEHFIGLDNLLRQLGRDGVKFYRSPNVALLSGPDGILATDDTIVIKINYQWPERGGTNADLLRGVIRRIVDHPDTFTGQVVVCENAQFNSVEGFDRTANNAQDHSLSPHDVVVGFQTQGCAVSHFDWTSVRYTSVNEYSAGDDRDGYVVLAYDPQLQGRPSYPKFRTTYGTYVSMRYGLWDPNSTAYDREHLKFVNLPVLKSHHATYGATAAVKHYMGVVTRELSTNSHSSIGRGILGAVIGQIQPADLNILDCIWINANPYDGPATSYAAATRRDQLVASLDPVALDIWAVTHILIPAFLANGYTPPWPAPSADPNDPNSAFRKYLDRSMNYVLAAGYHATNDLTQVDAQTWHPRGDLNCDGSVDFDDISPFVLALSDAAAYEATYPDCTIQNGDCDGNGAVDFDDINPFVDVLSG